MAFSIAQFYASCLFLLALVFSGDHLSQVFLPSLRFLVLCSLPQSTHLCSNVPLVHEVALVSLKIKNKYCIICKSVFEVKLYCSSCHQALGLDKERRPKKHFHKWVNDCLGEEWVYRMGP